MEWGAKAWQIRLCVECESLSKIEHRSYVVRGTNKDLAHAIFEVGSA